MKVESFDNVWDAIEDNPIAAASLRARSSLMLPLEQAVRAWGVPPSAAAKRLRVTTARVKELLSGDVDAFSMDDLVELAAAAGLAVTFEVVRPAA